MLWFFIPDFAYNSWGFKWFFASWMLMYLVTLVYLILKGKELESVFAKAMLLILLFFLPPVVNCLFLNVGGEPEYSRIAWGLLTVPMLGVGAVALLYDESHLKKKAVLLICVLLLAGNKTNSLFVPAQNAYKIPTESIEAIEMMNNCGVKTSQVGLLFPVDVKETVSVEEEVYFGMRSYSSQYEYALVDANSDMNEYEYLLGGKEKQWIENGWEIVGQTENLILYHRIGR
jgi:hypothetical protein